MSLTRSRHSLSRGLHAPEHRGAACTAKHGTKLRRAHACRLRSDKCGIARALIGFELVLSASEGIERLRFRGVPRGLTPRSRRVAVHDPSVSSMHRSRRWWPASSSDFFGQIVFGGCPRTSPKLDTLSVLRQAGPTFFFSSSPECLPADVVAGSSPRSFVSVTDVASFPLRHFSRRSRWPSGPRVGVEAGAHTATPRLNFDWSTT